MRNEEEIKKGCGGVESLEGTVCSKKNLCFKCQAELKGFLEGKEGNKCVKCFKKESLFCGECCNDFIDNKRRDILKVVGDEDGLYPKDVFPELSPEQLKEINEVIIEKFGYPLDRLSAHIARLILKGVKREIMEKCR